MSTSKSPNGPLAQSTDDEFPGYRPVSSLAVTSFLLSLASILVFTHLAWSFIPVLAFVCSVLALRRIAALQNGLVGRRFALAGLVLSLSFGLMAPTYKYVSILQIRAEARRFARQWFDDLAKREPDRAFLSQMPASSRTDETFKMMNSKPEMRQMLRARMREPAVIALLTLGEKAKVRYCQQASFTESTIGECLLIDVYAVTTEEGGQRTTFFVDMKLQRNKSYNDETYDWGILSTEFRTTPPPFLASQDSGH
jgi:hypothetical protein